MHPIRPRFPPPTIFATDHQQNYLALTAALLSRSMIEDVLFRLDSGSEGNWPGCIKPCVIVVTVLVKHGRMVDERYEGSFWCIYFRFFFFFFFFTVLERRFISINARREFDDDSIKREREGGRGNSVLLLIRGKLLLLFLKRGRWIIGVTFYFDQRAMMCSPTRLRGVQCIIIVGTMKRERC